MALVIGNGAYDSFARLSNPPNDATAVADKLSSLGFDVTRTVDADLAAMNAAIAEFTAKARDADVAVVFYAGHGLQVDGENYLVPTDARFTSRENLRQETLPASSIYESLVAAGPEVAILILDACRDNPLAAAMSEPPGLASGSVSASAFVQQPGSAGMIIGFAAAPGAVAYDGASGNSPFTTALLQWIDRPGLELGTMFRRVRGTVVELTRGAQVPWVEEALLREVYLNGTEVQDGDSPNGDARGLEVALLETIRALDHPEEQQVALEFIDRITSGEAVPEEGGLTQVVAQPIDDQFMREGLIWLSIRESTDLSLFDEFLATFPDSRFANLAQARREELVLAAMEPPDVTTDLGAQLAVVEAGDAVAPTLAGAGASEGEGGPSTGVDHIEPLVALDETDTAVVLPVADEPASAEAALGLDEGGRAAVQRLLAAAGADVGAPDGVLGKQTRRGIAAFQAAAGLAGTGYLDQATLAALVKAAAGKALRADGLDDPARDAIHQVASIGEEGPGASPTVLRVATISRNDAVHAYWEQLARRFEADHPGTRVEFAHQRDNLYKANLLAMLGSDTPPDIIHTWGGGHLDALRTAGFLRDLTEEMSAGGWALEFRPGALQNYTFDGHIYGAPTFLASVSLWANKPLLDRAGVTPEDLTTWDGLIGAIPKLQAAGITPIAIGGRDSWTFQFLWGNLAEGLGGATALEDAVAGDNGGFASPPFVAASERLAALAALRPFQPGFLDATEDDAGNAFARGEAALTITGNWRLESMKWNWPGGPDAMRSELLRLGFPGANARNDAHTYGGVDGYAVNADAPDIAVDLVRLLTSETVQSEMAAFGASIPSVSGADLRLDDPIVAAVAAELLDSRDHQLYYDQALGPVAGDVLNAMALAVGTGQATPAEATARIEEAVAQLRLERGLPAPAAP